MGYVVAFIFVLIFSGLFGWAGSEIARHKSASSEAGFWLGFLLWPIGLVIAALLGPTAEIKSGDSAKSKVDPPDPSHRNLGNAQYKVWLIEAYKIEKNDVLGEFVCGDRSFETVADALVYAHAKEEHRSAAARLEQQAKEQERVRLEEQSRLEAEANAVAEAEARAARRPKEIAAAAVTICAVIGLPWLALNWAAKLPDGEQVEPEPDPEEGPPRPPEQEVAPPPPVAPSLPVAPPPPISIAPTPLPIRTQENIPPRAPPAEPASPPPSRARAAQRDGLNRWLTRIQSNYPRVAAQREIEGNVDVAVSVGPDGRVTACSVTATSGSEDLDQAACEGMRRYARYEPALDDAGNPTSGRDSINIWYQLDN